MTNPEGAPDRAQLLSVIAHARAGALDRAWALYRALDVAAGPAALAVKGRLLKDMALQAEGAARLTLYGEAAQAYRQAAEAGGGTYPLINAATLSLLCGAGDSARQLAGEALARIAAHPDEPETPYYRAATRAEALLLLGREDDAQAALAEGVALAPRAWEDHASTLRQFAIILAAQGGDDAWLNAYRPPRSLHFGGHMAFRADPAPTDLSRDITAVLELERVGFGYGALAAGADIIVAEALIDCGAALHIILPGTVEGFASVSVDPHGPAWRRRFDAALAAAETVRTVEPAEGRPDETMITLADEIAMGGALINARLLASDAVQLLVMPDDASGADGASARSRDAWARAGRRQMILHAPRAPVDVPADAGSIAPRYRAAVLAIRVAREDRQAGLDALKAALEQCPAPDVAPSFTGDEIVLAYDDVAHAALAAAVLAGAARSVGGHYGIAERVHDPFAGSVRLAGRALDLALAAAASAPPGAACVTDDFAAALAVAAPEAFRPEFVGELGSAIDAPPVGLFALKPQR
jgi:hypothetical protein